MTPDDLTQSQTLHITMSQQAEWSSVRGRDNGLRGQKPSQITLKGKYAADPIMGPLNYIFVNYLSISACKGPAEVQVLCFKVRLCVFVFVWVQPHIINPSNSFCTTLLSFPECLRRWETKSWLAVQQCVHTEEQHTSIPISISTHPPQVTHSL